MRCSCSVCIRAENSKHSITFWGCDISRQRLVELCIKLISVLLWIHKWVLNCSCYVKLQHYLFWRTQASKMAHMSGFSMRGLVQTPHTGIGRCISPRSLFSVDKISHTMRPYTLSAHKTSIIPSNVTARNAQHLTHCKLKVSMNNVWCKWRCW